MRKTWKEMLVKYDKDNSGLISPDEFLQLMNDYWTSSPWSYFQYDLENAKSYLQCID